MLSAIRTVSRSFPGTRSITGEKAGIQQFLCPKRRLRLDMWDAHRFLEPQPHLNWYLLAITAPSNWLWGRTRSSRIGSSAAIWLDANRISKGSRATPRVGNRDHLVRSSAGGVWRSSSIHAPVEIPPARASDVAHLQPPAAVFATRFRLVFSAAWES